MIGAIIGGGYLTVVAPDATAKGSTHPENLAGDSTFEVTVKNTGLQSCTLQLELELYSASLASGSMVDRKMVRKTVLAGGEKRTYTVRMQNVPTSAESVLYRIQCANALV